MTRPTFITCGVFSGKEGQSSSRWFKKLEYDLAPVADQSEAIPALEYMGAVNLLLSDDAELWADFNMIKKQHKTSMK